MKIQRQTIIDLFFCSCSLINMALLISQADLNIGSLTLCLCCMVFTMMWFLMKLHQGIKSSKYLILILFACNGVRLYIYSTESTLAYCIEILLHIVSTHNCNDNYKRLCVIPYLAVVLVFNWDPLKILLAFVIGSMMLADHQQQEPSPNKTRSLKNKSMSFSPEHESKPYRIQEFASFQDNQNDIKKTLREITENKRNPIIMIDLEAKPLAYNNAAELLLKSSLKKDIQFAIVSMDILKSDKHSHQMISRKNDSGIKIDTNRQFLRQQSSIYQNQSQQFQIYQSGSTPHRITMHDVLQSMIRDKYDHAQILDYKSDQIESHYLIEICLLEDMKFLIEFIDIKEKIVMNTKGLTKKLMNQLFRSFSHEFSTSLNCIRILAENAQEILCEEYVTGYITPILNSCYILNSIVQDIRDYSMIIQKNFVMTMQPTNILDLVNETAKLFKPQLRMKGIKLILDVEDVEIRTDAQRVKQCLINLLSNATKFTDQGQIKITAHIKMHNELQQFIEIGVHDTGAGIDELNQQALLSFLKSSYKSNLKQSQSSYGIGLLISNFIAQALSGRHIVGGIKFKSDVSGSSFWFLIQDIHNDSIELQSKYSLNYRIDQLKSSSYTSQISHLNPLFKNCTSQKYQTNSTIKSNAPRSAFHTIVKSEHSENFSQEEESYTEIEQPYMLNCFKRPNEVTNLKIIPLEVRILIVDDEYTNIYALSLMLKRMNTPCDSANNGLEGFKKFVKNPYQIIFMDIEMPILNGFRSTEKIMEYCKSNHIECPYIIAQTAYTDIGTQSQCFQVGMKCFLSKPINTSDLKMIINNLLNK